MRFLRPSEDDKIQIDALQNAALFAKKKEKDTDVLARTMWGEARGEGSIGMQAVANVVLNRRRLAVEDGIDWWGKSITQICMKPYQFSVWNKDDANFLKIKKIDETDIHFKTAMRIARRAVYAALEDVTSGATHYHAAGYYPYWASGVKPVKVIGNHIFYNLMT